MSRKRFLLSTISVFAITIAQPIAAAAADAGDIKLEEIVVTARKTAESLMAVPVAVTAITSADIEDRGIRDALVDVATFTPGYSFQGQAAGSNRQDRAFKSFTVRGINPESPQFYRQAAYVFIDGSPIAGGNVEGITNIERVEVIKGPQSAYFGRATFSGALNYITRSPGNEYHANADVTVAEWGTTDIYLGAEGPLVKDKLSVRISGHDYHTDGQYTNIEEPQNTKLGKRDTKSIAATLVATPTDQLHAKAFLNIWVDNDGPPANSTFNSTNGFNCNAGGAPAGTLNYHCGPISVAPEDTRVQNTIVSPFVLQALEGTASAVGGPNFLTHFGFKRDALQAHLYLDYTFNDGYVLSGNATYDRNVWEFLTDTTFLNVQNPVIPNANYGKIPNVLPVFSRSAFDGVRERDNTAEVRLTSPRTDRFKWTVGSNYNYLQNNADLSTFGITGLVPGTSPDLTPFYARTLGLFGSVSYDFGGGFSITGEARYQWDTIHQESPPIVAQTTFKAFTPRVTAQYEWTKDVMVYASYAEGTRPGEFNTPFYTLTPAQQAQVTSLQSFGPSVPEERMRMGELGTKGLFLDGTLRVLADIYYGYWSNRHINNNLSLLNANGTLTTIALIGGGGEVRLKGLEFKSEYRATKELTLEATFSVSDSSIVSTSCTACIPITGNRYPVGTQLANYPKVKGTLSATYRRPVFDDTDGYIRADYIYTGKIYDTDADTTWTVPTSKINLRIGVEHGQTRFEVYGTNITDNRVPVSIGAATNNLNGTNVVSVSLADKATYGIRLSQKF